ncbi:hypothetical protein NQD34_014010, partial [Periophthalmus magnuspinnatus]
LFHYVFFQIWKHELIQWDPDQFCGITHFTVPRELLWQPDLFLYEMTEKDMSPSNPYLMVFHNGTVLLEEDMKVISTCKMDMHKFPFDTQQCNLTLGSAIHSADEVRMRPSFNSSRVTEFTRELLRTQGEWEFIRMSVDNYNLSYSGRVWEILVYTCTVKRRPLLHVINLLIPIMFFLVLDLASFFISDHRSEKLGFKVTVLLAISVLLLILNDILPSTSNDTPLIATYCIVIFAMMMFSVLETVLVTFLMDRSQRSQRHERDAAVMSRGLWFNPPVCSRARLPPPAELVPLITQLKSKKELSGLYERTEHRCTPCVCPAGGALTQTCRFHDVLEHLNLTRDSELFYMTRPVNDHREPTLVTMEMCLYAILDVVEKDQKFIPYVWTVMKWQNDFIWWNKDDFCGIDQVSIPTEVLWKPDITIEEMVEKDKAPPSPHLFIRSNGEVEVQNDQVLVSTCRMRVHKFPFDTQSCSLSFNENSREATQQSIEVMRIQYEWLFISIDITNTTTDENQDKVIYTV